MINEMKLLILEDSRDDAELLQITLKRAGLHFKVSVVSNRNDFIEALDSFAPGFILSDHRLPQFSSNHALEIARKKFPYIPFILITGAVSDEFAASIIKEGADDYLLKSNLKRLPTAIQQAIEKKQAEKVQGLLVSVVNSSDDAIISKTLDGLITSWNNGAERLFGYADAEAIGKNISLVIPPDRLNEEREIMEKVKRGIFIKHYETQRKKKNGDLVYISLMVSPIKDSQGNIIGASKIMRDITERIKAEEQAKKSFHEKQEQAERMSTILNSLPANIALLDNRGTIADINDAWRNFTDDNGFIGNHYGIGDSYLDISKEFFCEDETAGKTVARGIKAVLTHKLKEFVFEYACHSPGIKIWYRMVATPLQDKKYTGAVIMHLDISELRRLEQERLESTMEEQKKITRAMLHAGEQERNQLGRELHDNISQLLAAIKMKLSFGLANSGKDIPAIKECIVHVQEAITETRNLSHRMVIPRFSESGFKNALDDLAANYNNKQRPVHVAINLPEENKIPAAVKESVYRIVQEQLHNIDKHAGATAVSMDISAGTGRIKMVIADNGIGFDVKKKTKGIGLTNILNRAESYNGSATIVSAPGKGCKLQVEIPLTDV
jgi:PAS domain S-box-containing protein